MVCAKCYRWCSGLMRLIAGSKTCRVPFFQYLKQRNYTHSGVYTGNTLLPGDRQSGDKTKK